MPNLAISTLFPVRIRQAVSLRQLELVGLAVKDIRIQSSSTTLSFSDQSSSSLLSQPSGPYLPSDRYHGHVKLPNSRTCSLSPALPGLLHPRENDHHPDLPKQPLGQEQDRPCLRPQLRQRDPTTLDRIRRAYLHCCHHPRYRFRRPKHRTTSPPLPTTPHRPKKLHQT